MSNMQSNNFNKPIHIPRPQYDQRLQNSIDTPNIKVLTGIRRCGKSTLLKMFVESMINDGFPLENIFSYKFDEFGMPVNPDASWLLNELQEAIPKINSDYPFRVFLDEIQEVDGWEKVVRQLHTRENTDVFITGSNAHVLSSDLSTYLAGRYEEIKVYPLSFVEYLNFRNDYAGEIGDIEFELNSYITFGGMPGLFELPNKDPETISQELSTLFDAIILNDVAKRSNISDVDLLTKIVRYLFSTSGSLFSTKKVSDVITSSGRKVKPETVDNYILALTRAFALYECGQEGLSGKKILRPLRKFYPADTGFRNLPTRFSGVDLGYQLENIVYIELKRRGFSISVGALSNAEIDFIATNNSGKEYFQVSASLLDEAVFDREITPLQEIKDSFPKTILTLDGWRSGTTDSGITIVKLSDWLMSEY